MLTEFKIIFGVILTTWLGREIQVDGGLVNIVGGSTALKGEFPWMVSIQFNSVSGLQPICGGAIINSTHVVTAAHCADFAHTDLLIVAGAHNISQLESTQQRRGLTSIYTHPDYQNDGIIRHDLAVLEVYPPFIIDNSVRPISLPSERHRATGYCWIAGWGQTKYVITSDVLVKARIPIMGSEECRQIYTEHLDVNTQICAGYRMGGVDVCYGDTGGPLMCDDLGYIYLAGIASWGYKCGQPNFPGVYTEVSFYIKNLSETLRKIIY